MPYDHVRSPPSSFLGAAALFLRLFETM